MNDTSQLEGEPLITLTEACKLVPGRDGSGKHLHLSSMVRRITGGTKNPHTGETIRLEAIRDGGRWLTSVAAVSRYRRALVRRHPVPNPETPKQADQRRARVRRELEAMGIKTTTTEAAA